MKGGREIIKLDWWSGMAFSQLLRLIAEMECDIKKKKKKRKKKKRRKKPEIMRAKWDIEKIQLDEMIEINNNRRKSE